MDISDPVPLLALVISFFALSKTSLQLLQQLFGTADVYSACCETFIGVWHHTRKRLFVLSELRYVVMCTTPHITVMSSTEFSHFRRKLGSERVRWLDDYSSPEDSANPLAALIKDTIHPNKETRPESNVEDPSDPYNIELGEVRPWRRRAETEAETEVPAEFSAETGQLVSWLQFL